MQKQTCSVHASLILSICFHKECTQPFLCRKCCREHPESHDSHIRDVNDLIEDEKWIETHERERDSMITQIEKLFQEKKNMLNENENLLKEGMSLVIANFESKKKMWIEELHRLMGSTDEKEVQGVLSKLEDQ